MTAPSVALGALLPERQELPNVTVRDLTMDSRVLSPGAVFVALRGTRVHGLAYAPEALSRGAVAVLWDENGSALCEDSRCVHVPHLRHRLPELARRLFGAWPPERPLVAITGTDGKTSVSHQVSFALTHLGVRCAVIGTLGVGAPEILSPTGHTTPDVLELHRHLANLAQSGFGAVTLEASSHALEQGRLDGLQPRVAVLTHLGRDHLDYHGSLAAYAEAKASLFRLPGVQAMVVNMDDELGRRLLSESRATPDAPPCWTYGMSESSDPASSARHIQASNVAVSGNGLAFDVHIGSSTGRVSAPLFGVFQVANLLATLGTLLALGYPPARAISALSAVRGVPGRMERFTAPAGPVLVVDYAHTARALASALRALRPHVIGRLWVVFGCGGNRDPGKRPAMGAVASRLADRVIVTDDNPRDELPAAIRRAIMDGCVGPATVQEIDNRATAIRSAVAEAESGDVVLIAGKGHETTQVVAGKEYPFSDRELARELVSGSGNP